MSEQKQTITLGVTGMTCGSCKRHVEQALASVAGVTRVDVDVKAGRAEVVAEGAELLPRLIAAVQGAGYGAWANEGAAPVRAGSSCHAN